ncbi:RDD family protein [Spartinivicinus poritis]|uniref:RDD family protein n=1 Tax=Spartinivicinus poritis TaxID=2994640 RepID=A0ABT5U2N4_9GAMM|nr:RDD family protein [Spartinivicinus sp. A2-2]MDE1460630.1 RDD family protein [Spartinivicinus sp. A2-2]
MTQTLSSIGSAPLWRRLAAMIYDSLLLVAIAIVISGLHLWLSITLVGEAKATAVGFKWDLSAILLIGFFGFYAYFWRRSGQTPGMIAWRIMVVNYEGRTISLKQCLIRFIAGIPSCILGGIGILWVLFDPKDQAIYDYAAKTEVVLLEKNKK